MRIAAYSADSFGCCYYRVLQPHRALRAHGVQFDNFMSIPSGEGGPGSDFNALLRQIERYDLVLVQRVTQMNIMRIFRNACNILGKPLVLETDDDYLHLERSNPCYFSTALDGTMQQYRELAAAGLMEQAQMLVPQLEAERIRGLQEVKELTALADAVIVTTEELKQVYAPYNKNIIVLPNNVEQIFFERDYSLEACDPVTNQLKVDNKFGMYTVPAFYPKLGPNGESIGSERILRIGYTGTTSHIEDFNSIKEYWDRLIKKYAEKCWFVYIGDPYFADASVHGRNRRIWIPDAQYDIYRYNLRNLDIGIAPLLPTPFNMGKSEIKALEYSMWGILPVVPDYVTYTRTFTHGETCLTYRNGKEFLEVMEEAINNHRLRNKIAKQAQMMVAQTRTEESWTQARFNLYESLVKAAPGYKVLKPNKAVA